MGILQRYVLGEVVRSFLLAAVTMTLIFVIFMVAAQAMRNQILTAEDIMHVIPYVIPGTLPYTIPVSLLFSVTVVYGRMAGDNEVIAVKASGQSAMIILWPSILFAGGISASLFFLTRTWIPDCTYQAKLIVFKDVEETFYKYLRANREFKPMKDRMPFFIKVKEVEGRDLVKATIKHLKPGGDKTLEYDTIIQAERATIRLDFDRREIVVKLKNAQVKQLDRGTTIYINDPNGQDVTFPLAENRQMGILDKSIQEVTDADIKGLLAKYQKLLDRNRVEQAVRTGLFFGSGQLDKIDWPAVEDSYRSYPHWESEVNKYETERELRRAMSVGSLLFVILGAPVGILFARRDFLSAFISCFLPIIMIYYPLTLLGQNMGKEGQLSPMIALWIGNALLASLSLLVLPPVIKH